MPWRSSHNAANRKPSSPQLVSPPKSLGSKRKPAFNKDLIILQVSVLMILLAKSDWTLSKISDAKAQPRAIGPLGWAGLINQPLAKLAQAGPGHLWVQLVRIMGVTPSHCDKIHTNHIHHCHQAHDSQSKPTSTMLSVLAAWRIQVCKWLSNNFCKGKDLFSN